MKKILLSIGAILSVAALNAQILTASDAAAFGTWSAIDADQDTYTWGLYDLTGVGSSIDGQGECAISFSWGDPGQGSGNETALTPDNWLISPAMNLTGYTAASLSFAAGTIENTTYFAENYSVYIVTAADATALATALATATPAFTEVLPAGDAMQPHTVSMTSFAGQNNVYVAFRHHNCTDMYTLVLDDVVVSGTASIEENTVTASVYPNPAGDVLNIKLNANATSVSIIGMDGKVISTESVNANTVEVNVSNLVAGVYVYEIVAENGEVVRNTFVKK